MIDDDDSGLSAFGYYEDFTESSRDAAIDDPEIPNLLFSASDAAETVTVTAMMNGSIHEVRLSPRVIDMTEVELAREILAVARVAAAKGRAGQYELIAGLLDMQGQDPTSARELLEEGLGLPTPARAAAAEAELTTRHLPG